MHSDDLLQWINLVMDSIWSCTELKGNLFKHIENELF